MTAYKEVVVTAATEAITKRVLVLKMGAPIHDLVTARDRVLLGHRISEAVIGSMLLVLLLWWASQLTGSECQPPIPEYECESSLSGLLFLVFMLSTPIIWFALTEPLRKAHEAIKAAADRLLREDGWDGFSEIEFVAADID